MFLARHCRHRRRRRRRRRRHHHLHHHPQLNNNNHNNNKKRGKGWGRGKMEPASPIELSETPASRQITVACLGLFTDASILCDSLRFIEILFFCSFFLSFFISLRQDPLRIPIPSKPLLKFLRILNESQRRLGCRRFQTRCFRATSSPEMWRPTVWLIDGCP